MPLSLLFSGAIRSWRDELASRDDPEDMESLHEFLDDLTAGGGTNLYGVLRESFEIPEVDTIFLLSDGEPSVGARIEPSAILAAVRLWNRDLGVVVHCISLGSSITLLEEIAETCGGQYVRF